MPAATASGEATLGHPDGAAEVASQGFFDVDNVPPWGTWVGTVRPVPGSIQRARQEDVSVLLLAFVPNAVLPLAADGPSHPPGQPQPGGVRLDMSR